MPAGIAHCSRLKDTRFHSKCSPCGLDESPPGDDLRNVANSAIATATAGYQRDSWLILLGNESPSLQGCLVVVGALLRPDRQFHFCLRHSLVGNQAQQMRNAVQPRPLLVVRTYDVPWRVLRVGGFQ